MRRQQDCQACRHCQERHGKASVLHMPSSVARACTAIAHTRSGVGTICLEAVQMYCLLSCAYTLSCIHSPAYRKGLIRGAAADSAARVCPHRAAAAATRRAARAAAQARCPGALAMEATARARRRHHATFRLRRSWEMGQFFGVWRQKTRLNTVYRSQH